MHNMTNIFIDIPFFYLCTTIYSANLFACHYIYPFVGIVYRIGLHRIAPHLVTDLYCKYFLVTCARTRQEIVDDRVYFLMSLHTYGFAFRMFMMILLSVSLWCVITDGR